MCKKYVKCSKCGCICEWQKVDQESDAFCQECGCLFRDNELGGEVSVETIALCSKCHHYCHLPSGISELMCPRCGKAVKVTKNTVSAVISFVE